MNKFEKQLEKWNHGLLRGAQAKLAKQLQVSTATVALWSTGKRHPSKGYVAKMARLFNLDELDVARLFTPSTIYPEVFPSSRKIFFRDSSSLSPFYCLTSDRSSIETVSLPVLEHLPNDYPYSQQPLQATACWVIPQQAAAKASFLFRLPTKQDAARLLFVSLCLSWEDKKHMLARTGKKYQVLRVSKKREKIQLTNEQGTLIDPASAQPLGIVLKQITTLDF